MAIAALGVALLTGAAPAQAQGQLAQGQPAQSPPAQPRNLGLVAVGRLPASSRDSFGETFGSGSALVIDPTAWRRTGEAYEGALYLLPDRGYNVAGTTNYRSRLNRLAFRLTAPASGTGTLDLRLAGTMLLKGPDGRPLSGLDPTGVRPASGPMPELPVTADVRVTLDAEGLARLPDGSFLVSDEYGPYVYRFDGAGRLLGAIRPPEALIPRRHGRDDFSSDNPGPGAAEPSPKDPETGRQNNQGLEGLTLTPDGTHLVAVLQSATRQDGGDKPSTRRTTRALVYDIADMAAPRLAREVAVPLPTFRNAKGETRVAAASEVQAIGSDRFLLLSRDSGNGWGQPGSTSLYRRIDILDLNGATDIAGTPYDATTPLAPKGVLDPSVRPATLHPFIDLNDNAALAPFGLHNGPPHDATDLSEKWEAMGLAPARDAAAPDDWFLFVANDNDFLTRDGYQVGAPYHAEADVDTMVLVYRVRLPGLLAH